MSKDSYQFSTVTCTFYCFIFSTTQWLLLCLRICLSPWKLGYQFGREPYPCLPKTNRLPDISPEKIAFIFQVQQRITMQGLPPQPSMCKSSYVKGRRNFHRREQAVGRARVNKESIDSHWLSTFEERSLSFSQ